MGRCRKTAKNGIQHPGNDGKKQSELFVEKYWGRENFGEYEGMYTTHILLILPKLLSLTSKYPP